MAGRDYVLLAVFTFVYIMLCVAPVLVAVFRP